MKILYAIQGTGNGHVTVALEVLPHLMHRAEVDILISGNEVDITLPWPVKYRLHGLGFVFGKKGGIDYLETYKKARLKRFFEEINNLPVKEYDLVISDFEPVSAWACHLNAKPCIGFSHQAAVVNGAAPKPRKTDLLGLAVLKHYAPVTVKYGFHFSPYAKNIFTPIIRKAIRTASLTDEGHYTVYLPAYSDKRVAKMLSRFSHAQWRVFSKRCLDAYVQGNITFQPVTAKAFVASIASAKGVLCGGGFQTPSEVLFMGKKLLVVPMKGQYEQQCNAAALKELGVPVLKNFKKKQHQKIEQWLTDATPLHLNYADETEWIVDDLLQQAANVNVKKQKLPDVSKLSRFRDLLLKRIFYQTSL